MEQIIRIGMDTSKHIFQLHGVDGAERPVLRKRLGRKQMVAFFAKLPPTVIGIEACGAAHYWARVLAELGHQGEADRAATREALRQAQQERRAGRRGPVRGDEPTDDEDSCR